jgi:hypothetical protein
MGRLAFVAVFSLVACAAGFAKSGTFAAMPPSLHGINAEAPPYTSEEEKLVSEIAGSILNIAAFADHFEPGDPFQVRNVAATGTHSKFSLARRAEVFTVELPGHVWHPASYVRLARSFMADAADPMLTEDLAQDHTALPAVFDVRTAASEDARLTRLLAEHPRSAAMHRRAALILGAEAKQRSGPERRLLLCRITAHLAVARALHPGALDTEGQLAELQLADLAATENSATAAPQR